MIFRKKNSWHNSPSNDHSVSTSPNACFCTTWEKHSQQNITFLFNVIWLL